MSLIFPKALETAAKTIDDPKVVGAILQALVGKKVKLNDLQKYILASAQDEIAERARLRENAAERKRRSRAK
jgi:regulator of sirC expression with transglutaminase-like and TPR domain